MKQAQIVFTNLTVVDVKSPDEWCEIHGVEIIDPDGWRHDQLAWETLITEQEFHTRVQHCTIRLKPKAEPVNQPAPDGVSQPVDDSQQTSEPDVQQKNCRPLSALDTLALVSADNGMPVRRRLMRSLLAALNSGKLARTFMAAEILARAELV